LHVLAAGGLPLAVQAPETMLQGKLSRSSDVYAFGVLLWELCTGGHAFKVSCRARGWDCHQLAKFDSRPQPANQLEVNHGLCSLSSVNPS
jgi:serine/threonine protein kinase